MRNDLLSVENILLVKRHRLPSEQTLRTAVDLARRCGAKLTFASVLEGGDQVDDAFRSTRLRELESLLSPHLKGIEADYRLIDDRLAASADQTDDFDLVFLADDQRSSEAGAREVRRLLRGSSPPVWLVGRTGQAPQRILAAVDIMTRDPVKRSLNLAILERALLLTSVYDAQLDILSVWAPPPSARVLAHRLSGDADRLVRTEDEARQRLQEALRHALRLGPALDQEPRLQIVGGLPAESIARTAEASRADLLVVGCVGRDGLAGWLLGDTAEKLSRRLDCSLLAVKPTPDLPIKRTSVGGGRAA